jgi:hypothetical protein
LALILCAFFHEFIFQKYYFGYTKYKIFNHQVRNYEQIISSIRVMGVPESKKKMVACTYSFNASFAWLINSSYTGISSCSVYLFNILALFLMLHRALVYLT